MKNYIYPASATCEFSEETLLLIEYYEEKFRVKQVSISKDRADNRIRWVMCLIAKYDETEEEHNKIERINNSHKYFAAVCKALDRGKLPADIKESVKPRKYGNEKRCNVKRIAKMIHLLKAAKSMGKKAFEKFIFIPDVNYVLNIIEKNKFGDLEYLFERSVA